MSEITPGQWVVIRTKDLFGHSEQFDAAEVERVTDKMVFAKANYRHQHPRKRVLAMPSEQAARRFVQHALEARAKAQRNEHAAWEEFRATIATLIESSTQ